MHAGQCDTQCLTAFHFTVAPALQDDADAGCGSSSDGEMTGTIEPQQDEKQLKAALTQGRVAQAKVGARQGYSTAHDSLPLASACCGLPS